MKEKSRQLINSSLVVLIGTLIYKGGFFVKEVILTSKLGISPELTIFISSFLIPSFICNALASSLPVGSSQQLVDLENKIDFQMIKSIFLKLTGLSLAFYIVIYFLVSFVFTMFDAHELQLVRVCSLLSIPFFVFMPLRGVLGQVLYLKQYHFLNLLISLVSPVVIIAFLLTTDAPDANNLMFNVTIASLFEMIAAFIATYYLGGISWVNRNSKFTLSDILRGFTLQILLMAPLLIHQIFAHFKGPNFLTLYNYAIKIPNIMTTMSLIITSSVMLPFFITNKDVDFSSFLKNKKILFVILSFIVFCLVTPYLSPLIVKLVYFRGKFTEDNCEKVSIIQTYYFWTIPISAVFLAYIRYLNSKNKDKLAIKLSATVTFTTFILCCLLAYMKHLKLIPFTLIASYIITIGTFLIFPFIFKESQDDQISR